jgi:hypothetical protein
VPQHRDMQAGLVTTTEAANALGIAPRSLSRWARDGVVTPALITAGGPHRAGRYWWNLADLRAQLRGVRTRPETGPSSDRRPRGPSDQSETSTEGEQS